MLSDKTRLGVSGLVSLLGVSSILFGTHVVDKTFADKTWKYGFLGWGLIALSGGLYSLNIVYNNMDIDKKIELKENLNKFCYRLGKCF
ncbi:MAG: hypothetical protein V1815_01335 [Candidatus Woesearchaeota archaeon]